MDRNNMIVGGLALVVGILLGVLFAPRGASVSEVERVLDERLVAVESGLADGIATLQGQVETTMAAMQGEMQQTMPSLDGQFADMSSRLESIESAVGEGTQSIAETVRQELEGRIASLDSAIAQQSEQIKSGLAGFQRSLAIDAVGEAPVASEGDGDSAAAESASPEDPDFVGIGAGRTAVFADGLLRAFVSRVDPDARTARLSINGATTALEVGESVAMTSDDGTFCRLTLSGLQGGEVALNAACGDDLPGPEGVRPGNILMLADGAVRVFVSGIGTEGESARIAVNSTDMQQVAVGESVGVTVDEQECDVTLDSVDRGHVSMSTSCGG